MFFISVGVDFDLRALFASPSAIAMVALLTVVACFVTLVPSLFYRLRFSWRETLSAGALLSSRLSLIIAAFAIALELDLVTPATNSAIILLAIVTCTLSPFLFNRIAPEPEEKRRRGTIVVGDGDLAGLLAQRLVWRGRPELALVGDCSGRIQQALDSCVLKFDQAPTKGALAAAGPDPAESLLAVGTYETINVEVARLARQTFGIPNVIAVASSLEHYSVLRAWGARWVQRSMAMILSLEGALEFPAAFELLARMRGVRIREAELRNPGLVDHALQELYLAGGALVMGIRRDDEVIVPRSDTGLRLGDVLMVVVPEEQFDKVGRRLEQSNAA